MTVLASTAAERRAAARRVRENIARVQTMSERDAAAILAELRATRDRLVARLVGGGSEFDQAFARSMIAEVDRETERLKQQLGPKFASMFRRIMDAGDADTLGMLRDVAQSAHRATSGNNVSLLTTSGIDATLVNFARENSADLVQQITEDMRAKINSALRRGATGTSTPTDIGTAIGDVVREAGRDPGVFGNAAVQTERILRTETARLYQGATEARIERTARETTLRVTKTWVHFSSRIPGTEPRQEHAWLDGVEIPHTEHFNVAAGPTWSRVSYEEAQRRGGTLGFKASGPQDSILPAGQAVNCKCGLVAGFEE